MSDDKGLKSGVAIKLDIEDKLLPLTPASRLDMAYILLFGSPIYDEIGNEVGRTDPLINEDESLIILGLKEKL